MASSTGSGTDESVHAKFQVEISLLQVEGIYTGKLYYVASPNY
jgi:hypothetical protein